MDEDYSMRPLTAKELVPALEAAGYLKQRQVRGVLGASGRGLCYEDRPAFGDPSSGVKSAARASARVRAS